MLISEALRRINFRVGTLDDISGRAVNPILSNRIILDALYEQMSKYALITKGIEDVYSFPLNTNTPIVAAPPLALRSEAYFFAAVIQTGVIFPIDMKSPRDVFPIFRINPMSGVTNWVMPWYAGDKRYLSMFPMKSTSANTTTLTTTIGNTDTTLVVASTAGFINNSGRITIDSEKIEYQYKDATHFYGCIRGTETTTAAVHTATATITENNFFLFYSRLPQTFTPLDDNFIELAILNHALEVVEDHMEGVLDATAYKLLTKIDQARAETYKNDYEELFAQYAKDIKKGSWRGRLGANVRDPMTVNESSIPFGGNFIY